MIGVQGLPEMRQHRGCHELTECRSCWEYRECRGSSKAGNGMNVGARGMAESAWAGGIAWSQGYVANEGSAGAIGNAVIPTGDGMWEIQDC